MNAFWEHPEGWQIIYPNNKEQMLQHIYEGKVIMMRGGADYLDAAEEKYPGIMKELEKFCAPIVYYWVKVLRVFPIQIGDTTYYDSIWAIEGPISRESQIDPADSIEIPTNPIESRKYYAKDSFSYARLGELLYCPYC